MDTTTAFIIVSLIMVANGSVLGLIHRDLPPPLRPAALYWQAGTLLVALGCVVFAFHERLPTIVTVTAANGLFVLALTTYYWALQRFYGMRPNPLQAVPAVLATAGVFWFAAFQPDTKIRIVIVAVVWVWLLSAAAKILLAQRDGARSRKMLAFILLAAIAFTVARTIVYFLLPLSPDFSITDNTIWMNLATPMFMTILPVVGATAFILMCSEQIRRQWEHAASTDYLTGLANRRTLSEVASDRFRLSTEQNSPLAVAVLDIDGFKAINDTYGHEFGDKALIHVAAKLLAGTRKHDMVARSGGEEFVVLLSHVDRQQAEAAAERLRLSVSVEPFTFEAATVKITVSVGVAVYQPGDENFDTILRRADAALYRAKSEGRDRVELAL